MPQITQVLDFWHQLGPKGWFDVNVQVDDEIRTRFGGLWGEVRDGGHTAWRDTPPGCLAYLIVADQFPRNMFRGDPRAFSTDEVARAAARFAVLAGHDLLADVALRSFFYLPFEHSESLGDQDWSVDLFEGRTTDSSHILHAQAHREVIRRYGRFPTRNAALSRANTPAEEVFLAAGGYGAVVRALGG